MFEAGILQDPYPLRQAHGTRPEEKRHSLSIGWLAQRKLYSNFCRYLDVLGADADQLKVPTALREVNATRRPSAKLIAREFARFALVYQALYSRKLSRRHVEAGFALVHRRLECVPAREDRVVIAGLAAVALAGSGMQVHLVVENDQALAYVMSILSPIFERLNYGVMCVEAGTEELLRQKAYQQQITIVSARECAMDFLRDAVNWPDRANPVKRKLDRIMGGKSRRSSNLLRGLPCAVLVDADSTLIDNARAPIALTQDAHPMHEVEALKQALEMVGHLQVGAHYELTGEGAEVALTELGQRQLAAWANELGGSWRVDNAARLMLAAAIVVTQLLKVDVHYQIERQQVVWLLDERLIPGFGFYNGVFLARLVALREDCEVDEQREVAARASYQQIFNRYIHLSGLAHSTHLIETELEKVYGLKCGHRWPAPVVKRFHHALLAKDAEQKLEWLKSHLAAADETSAQLILLNDAESMVSLQAELQSDFPHLQLFLGAEGAGLSGMLKAGGLVLAQNLSIEYALLLQPFSISCPLQIVTTQRSERHAQDLRTLYWMQRRVLKDTRRLLLLALDDELFAESSHTGLRNMVRFSGGRLGAYLLERKIQGRQLAKAKLLTTTRQQLLAHDETMQGLLSFSGRGLYE